MSSPIRLAVLDMAGTTVSDGGLVLRSFTAAIAHVGITESDPAYPGMLDHVRRTMGESKITVFRALLAGDEQRAQQANSAFEQAYAERVAQGECAAIDGAAEAIHQLRRSGIRVALTTGFSRSTRDRILSVLGWNGVADLVLTPAEAGRGRPYPDMALTALLHLEVDDVREMAVVGDTGYDMMTGTSAGAGIRVGVLTGAHGSGELSEGGATHVLFSIRELPELLTTG